MLPMFWKYSHRLFDCKTAAFLRKHAEEMASEKESWILGSRWIPRNAESSWKMFLRVSVRVEAVSVSDRDRNSRKTRQ